MPCPDGLTINVFYCNFASNEKKSIRFSSKKSILIYEVHFVNFLLHLFRNKKCLHICVTRKDDGSKQ